MYAARNVVDMDEEIPKVTQPTQPVTEALQLVAEPGGFVPELAVRVAFEDGSYLEPPTACQLRARLLDASGAVLVDESLAEAEVRRVGGQVELCTPGEEGRRAFLLRQDLRAPTKPGEYSLEHTELHAEFRRIFERRLEQCVERHGASVQKFYRSVAGDQARSTELYSGHTFAAVINSTMSFESFYEMMQDAKRGDFYWGVPLLQDMDTLEFLF